MRVSKHAPGAKGTVTQDDVRIIVEILRALPVCYRQEGLCIVLRDNGIAPDARDLLMHELECVVCFRSESVVLCERSYGDLLEVGV